MINIYTITIITDEYTIEYHRATTIEKAFSFIKENKKSMIRKATYDKQGFCVKSEIIKNF